MLTSLIKNIKERSPKRSAVLHDRWRSGRPPHPAPRTRSCTNASFSITAGASVNGHRSSRPMPRLTALSA
jgi:hypothetical protein